LFRFWRSNQLNISGAYGKIRVIYQIDHVVLHQYSIVVLNCPPPSNPPEALGR
tara:strand:+ start:334 stop:492 length:159 start_codon:yes stop_codon:yes gene_type:complete